MKKLTFVIAMLFAFETNAQNYLLDFAGTGASNTVESVLVENLNSGQSLTLNGTDILHLTGTTGINPAAIKQFSEIKIFPNPMKGNSIIQIFPPEAGDAVITVLDITGKIVVQFLCKLENSLQEFRLSGMHAGSYLISVEGKTYKYYTKLLCSGQADGRTIIEKIRTDIKFKKSDYKSTQATIDMAYTEGDRLLITMNSGNYSTVISNIPSSNLTIACNFISCTDVEKNNYRVVLIGTQTWMAENLKTTKLKDGTPIQPVIINTTWYNMTIPGYCWYNNDETTYKNTYGALYNWYAVNNRDLCPEGWHSPTDDEWTKLEDYLIANGYNYDGTTTGNKIAKSLGSTTLWISYGNEGEVGTPDFPAKRNATGFTGLPGGRRTRDGAYYSIGLSGFWWSATEDMSKTGLYRILGYPYVARGGYPEQAGFSVRCVSNY